MVTLTAPSQIKTKPNQPTEWKTPIPLTAQLEHSPPYPIEALPPLIQNAIICYQQYGQQPLPLIACSALSNVSLSCQALANVARDHYLISPVSLYFLVVASSGERKSAADHTFSKAIRQWQQTIREKLDPDVKIARTLHRAWRMEKEGLLNQIRRSKFSDDTTDIIRQALLKLESNEPQIPLLPTLFFEDTTQEALATHIANGWPSASVWSDEGGIVIGGHGMQSSATKFVALLNRLWDGKPFVAHRKASESFTIANRRLTVSIMMQPLILEQMLAKKSGISRHSGFLARSLMAFPKSAMGNRTYQEPTHSLSALPPFHQRITDCLNQTLSLDKTGCHNLPTLMLSPAAKNTWTSFFNRVETGLRHANQWQSIKDFASKAAENVARLAALFHLFEGKEGDINIESVEQAAKIIEWHMIEARSMLGFQPQTCEQDDAQKLLRWIVEKGLDETTPRFLQQYGPIRDKKQRDKAIDILEENHYLKTEKVKGKTILLINPLTH